MRDSQYPRRPAVLLGGIEHLARLIDKIRLRHAGGILDYGHRKGGFDKALITFLQVATPAFERRVLAGGTDGEWLNWVRAEGRGCAGERSGCGREPC